MVYRLNNKNLIPRGEHFYVNLKELKEATVLNYLSGNY
jgi:hypothetical protein